MKKIAITTLALSLNVVALDSKYVKGDCIVSIDRNTSWFKKVASVVAYTSIDGYKSKKYILLFHDHKSKSVIFEKSIEKFTTEISKENCIDNG